jgi:aminobenzoyl-glutamate transport protein
MTDTATPVPAPEAVDHSFLERILDGVERAGNKMPHPAILFLGLCVAVILLSQVLYWFDVKATFQVVKPPAVATEQTYYGGSTEPTDVGPTVPEPAKDYKVAKETVKVKGLLTGEGVRYLFTSFVSNFRNFSAMAIMLVVMIGVALAEAAGLIAALIRKLVGVSPGSTLTFIIVLLGIISSIASDAGYLVLIPLGGAAFKSVGRNPLAGIAAAFAGVAAGFGVNFLITPLDGVLTEITNDAAGGRARATTSISLRTSTSASARRSSSRSCSPLSARSSSSTASASGTPPTTARGGTWTRRTRPRSRPKPRRRACAGRSSEPSSYSRASRS